MRTKDTKEIKDILKAKRLENNLTMKDIAEAVGVSEATVSRWESGEISNMRRDRIYAYATKLGISPLVIMGYDEPQDKAKIFADMIKDFSEAEIEDVLSYMEFIKSKRK